jgi:hypothetical protein
MVRGRTNLDLGPGTIFNFNVLSTSTANPNLKFIDGSGALDRSFLLTRMSKESEGLGFAMMPLHTPAQPDCVGIDAIAKWIKTFDPSLSLRQVEKFSHGIPCTKSNDIDDRPFKWISQDFTEAPVEQYKPRRQDWRNQRDGMPESFRAASLDDGLKFIAATPFANGFWKDKPECHFPNVERLPDNKVRPWMVKEDGSPKQPFGQIYYTTPGAFFYQSTCERCHGETGKADSQYAESIRMWTGGALVVPSFVNGLFAPGAVNFREFDESPAGGGRNLAGNYFIWMAMEGTRGEFPPQVRRYLGEHQAQMLKGVRDACGGQIPTSQIAQSPIQFPFEIYKEVCQYNNLPQSDPSIQYDPATGQPVNSEAQGKWLDRAAYNAGWTIFEYLRMLGSNGQWTPGRRECEKVYSQRS